MKGPGSARPRAGKQHQRGLTTLVIVAALFFIASLTVAYTNRNLIFEQRTATNQARSSLAFEAAEGGVEWTLAMLNTGRIAEATCAPTADPALSTFRQRYLDIGSNGLVSARDNMRSGGARAWPTCVRAGDGWSCSCPSNAPTNLDVPGGTEVAPAFRMRFAPQNPPGPGQPLLISVNRPGLTWVQVNGCTRLESNCLDFPSGGTQGSVTSGDARARLQVLIALKPALPSPPLAAVTVRGELNVAGSLTAANPTRGGSGVAVKTGGPVVGDANIQVSGPAGAPLDRASLLLAQDAALASTRVPTDARFFAGLYGATPADYRDQPAAIIVDCTAAACSADRLRALAARNPGRVLWARGDVALVGGADLGTVSDPVLLVVEGAFSATNITVHGLVHGRADEWNVTGTGAILRGALVAEDDLNLGSTDSLTVVHDAAVLDALRTRYGSFVRVPGGWRDF